MEGKETTGSSLTTATVAAMAAAVVVKAVAGRDDASPDGLAGPAGPAGPQGPQGPQGSPGPAGPAGADATVAVPTPFVKLTYSCATANEAAVYEVNGVAQVCDVVIGAGATHNAAEGCFDVVATNGPITIGPDLDFGGRDFDISLDARPGTQANGYPIMVGSSLPWASGHVSLRYNQASNHAFSFNGPGVGDPGGQAPATAEGVWNRVTLRRRGASLLLLLDGVTVAGKTVFGQMPAHKQLYGVSFVGSIKNIETLIY